MSADHRTPRRCPWAARRATALALLMAAFLLPAAAVPAETEESAEGSEAAETTAEESVEDAQSPAESIAESLEDSPLLVDPAYDGAFPEDARERVLEQIEQGDLDLYVVVVPLVEGDTWNGETEALASAVHDRLGGGERHYLIINRSGGLDGKDMGVTHEDRSRAAFYGAMAVSYQTMGGERTIPDQVERGVEATLSEDPEAVYEAAVEEHDQERDARGTPGPSMTVLPWNPWAVGAVVVAALAVLAFVLLRVAGARTSGRAAPVAQHAAFDNADRARLDQLVERAERDLIELGERLRQDSSSPPRNVSRALDARDAASRIFDRMNAQGPNLPDAAGVLVLLDRAEDALAGLRDPRRPCYANPLHGTDTEPTQWREFGGSRTVKVPLCGECARAVRARVRPTVLPAEHEGHEVAYYEVPAEQSVWAATGYGSLRDDLVERVLRGEHTGRA